MHIIGGKSVSIEEGNVVWWLNDLPSLLKDYKLSKSLTIEVNDNFLFMAIYIILS